MFDGINSLDLCYAAFLSELKTFDHDYEFRL